MRSVQAAGKSLRVLTDSRQLAAGPHQAAGNTSQPYREAPKLAAPGTPLGGEGS